MSSEKRETTTRKACSDVKDFTAIAAMMERCCEGKTVTFDCSTSIEAMKKGCSCNTAAEESKKDSCCQA